MAAALRVTDPALLHYRSGAFFLERARQGGVTSALRDVLLGVVAAADDPIAGGRHKVFGSTQLAVIPQTSTIASHLPRAVGVALSLQRSRKLGVEGAWPSDAVTCAASATPRSTTPRRPGAINAGGPRPATRASRCRCCSSARTTASASASAHPPAGSEPLTEAARAGVRRGRRLRPGGSADGVRPRGGRGSGSTAGPAFLHLRTVRLMGHAGSDVEAAYRSPAEILDELHRDPLLRTARWLVDAGIRSPDEVLDLYEAKRHEVMSLAAEVCGRPQLTSPGAVMAPLALPSPPRWQPWRDRQPRPAAGQSCSAVAARARGRR